MLDALSWKEFTLVIGIGCAAWYGYLLFAGKLRTKRSSYNTDPAGQRGGNIKRTWAVTEEPEEEETILSEEAATTHLPEPEEARSLQALEGLADDLQQIIAEQSAQPDKISLLDKLQQEIARYPALNKPAFKGAISNLVIRAAQAECDIAITRAEADALWSHF